MATQFLYWELGQTKGAIVYDPRNPYEGQLIVTDNGEQWSAERIPVPSDHVIRPPPGGKLYRMKLANAQPEYRLSVEWARATVKGFNKIHTTLAGKFVSSVVVEYTSPLTKHLGSVEYSGFELIAKRSGHTLEAIHRAVNASVARAIEVWGWQCAGLEVKFHSAGNAFGLAYAPGAGARKISLNVQLLERYDLNSVARVVIHELCHHYREERWLRNQRTGDPHDKRFCEELAKADPEVETAEGSRDTRANRCINFADIPDTALDAAIKAKQRPVVEPVWAPNAGVLEYWILKSGQLRMSWEPVPGFRWTKNVLPISDANVLMIAKRFGPDDWTRTRVHLEPRYANYRGLAENTTFDVLIGLMLASFGRSMPKTVAYVTEARPSLILAGKSDLEKAMDLVAARGPRR